MMEKSIVYVIQSIAVVAGTLALKLMNAQLLQNGDYYKCKMLITKAMMSMR